MSGSVFEWPRIRHCVEEITGAEIPRVVICLTNLPFCGNIALVVLDGELAVPCTRNPP